MHIPTIQRSGGDDPGVMPAAPPAAVAVERLVPVAAPLAGLVVKGTLLTIITLGIYRFWYRTALRRYYWHNTTLAGDGFEYTGTGRELFIGFLIALAIFLPLYLVVTLIGLFGGQVLGPILSTIVATLIMPAVVQVLIYRARRYRLTRTRYRGVRFHQSGSGVGYLLRTMKWLILTALTLGILLPYLRRALERYKIENTWYGSAQGAFSAPVKPLMKSWLVLWLTFVMVVVLSIAAPLLYASGNKLAGNLASLVLSFSGAILFAMWIHYKVTEFRVFVAGTSFQGITLSSDLRSKAVVWLYIKYSLILLATSVAAFIVVAFLFGSLLPNLADPESLKLFFRAGAGVGITVVLGFVALLVYSLITEILFRRRLWALRAASISVTNLAALDRIVQTAGQEATGVGEAFDSGFDIAG